MKGFCLPFSPLGHSAVLGNPNWYFGGDLAEFIYLTEESIFKRYLIPGMKMAEEGPMVSITFSDMLSISEEQTSSKLAGQTSFKELLIKLHVEFDGMKGWYVPISYVDKDFSMIRGFVMGFGKLLADFSYNRVHKLNRMASELKAGIQLLRSCRSSDGTAIDLSLTLRDKTDNNDFCGRSMFVTRHYPDLANHGKLIIYDLVALDVDDVRRTDIWYADCDLDILEKDELFHSKLKMIQPVMGRCFSEGFTLKGVTKLADL